MMLKSRFMVLVGTITILMTMGFMMPVYAEVLEVDEPNLSPISTQQNIQIEALSDEENIVYDNGGNIDTLSSTLVTDSALLFMPFTLSGDVLATDFHYAFRNDGGWDGTIKYFVFSDNSNQPSLLIASGDAQNTEMELIGGVFVTWFDFEVPVNLQGATKYWIGIHNSDVLEDDGVIGWFRSDNPQENRVCQTLNFVNWFCFDNEPTGWFKISGNSGVVGGETLPINQVALLITGAQTNAVWIMSVLAVIGSAAFGALYITSKKC